MKLSSLCFESVKRENYNKSSSADFNWLLLVSLDSSKDLEQNDSECSAHYRNRLYL
jgi:hypothetical protein